MPNDYEYAPHTPILHSATATNYILSALIAGAVLALIVHTKFGVAPTWIAGAIMALAISVALSMALLRHRKSRLSSDSKHSQRASSKKIKRLHNSGKIEHNDTVRGSHKKNHPKKNDIPDKVSELEAIYQHMPIGIGVVDSELRWMKMNKLLNQYFETTRELCIGKKISATTPSLSRYLESYCKQALTGPETTTERVIYNIPPTSSLTHRVLKTIFHRISNHDSTPGSQGKQIVIVMIQDITQNERALVVHKAHTKILNMSEEELSLDSILAQVADSIEELFPLTKCMIVTDHKTGNQVLPVNRKHDIVGQELLDHPLPANTRGIFAEVIGKNKEVLLNPIQADPTKPLTKILLKAGYHSCWLKPISLSNGVVWGACAISSMSSDLNPSNEDRDQLSVLLNLAATVIERHEYIQAVKTISERLEYAEQLGEVGVFDWNPETGRVIWTAQMERLYGYTPGDFTGTISAWKELITENDLPVMTEILKSLLRRKERAFRHEHRFIHGTGEVRWSSLSGGIEYNIDGKPRRIIGVATDITERKRIQSQADDDRRRLEQALEAGNLGFWDWNIQTGRVQFGGCWGRMLGYQLDEIAADISSWELLIHPDDKSRTLERLHEHLTGKTTVYECEHRLRKKDGSWVWILDRGSVIERTSDGTPIRAVGVHADISEQHSIREALQNDSRKKDAFLATLAHELRNPLAPIRTGLQILRISSDETSNKKVREMMERQLHYMVRLIDDLLDIARITQGTLVLQKSECTMDEIIELALDSSRATIEKKHHLLTVDIPDDSIGLDVDKFRFAQVISNILTNAAKYTPPNGFINVAVTKSNTTGILIAIKDSGIGIPPQAISSMFDMFTQDPTGQKYAEGGLGIGLALAKKIVELHGGTITAQNNINEPGCTFFITLSNSQDTNSTETKAPANSEDAP